MIDISRIKVAPETFLDKRDVEGLAEAISDYLSEIEDARISNMNICIDVMYQAEPASGDDIDGDEGMNEDEDEVIEPN